MVWDIRTDIQTDIQTDGQTDGWMDKWTDPLLEIQGRILKLLLLGQISSSYV